jgi:3-phenylpropionate/trans-cinnamate dioxygenase ferredoxin reductase component
VSRPDRIVVVGAGLAGARSCAELRARGHTGELILLGAERHPPYDRPPLSKAVLAGTVTDTTLPDELGCDFRPDCAALGLGDGVVQTSRGEVDFDGLVLAFGARPLRLPGDSGTTVLRTIDDALAIRERLRPGARVVIVGAGWIGAEVATAAAAHGADVTVLEAAATPLSASVGATAGAATMPWYEAAGVELRTGVRVVAAGPDEVRLEDGSRLAADLVLSALGVRPDLGWLAGAGLELGSGVRVDAALRTSRPGVVAVGDCAERWSPRAGRLIRMEHWDDALHSPEVAAATLLGEPGEYDPVPYVWSEQFGHYLQCVGRPGGREVRRAGSAGPREVRRAGADGSWALAWLDENGVLTGFLAADRQRDVLQARKAIAAGRTPDPDRLADPAIPVRSTW